MSINRSRIYYQAKPISAEQIELRDSIYSIWDERNHKGSRTIKAELVEYYDTNISRGRVQRIMSGLRIHGALPKRSFSNPGELKYKYPYYLGGMSIYMADMVLKRLLN